MFSRHLALPNHVSHQPNSTSSYPGRPSVGPAAYRDSSGRLPPLPTLLLSDLEKVGSTKGAHSELAADGPETRSRALCKTSSPPFRYRLPISRRSMTCPDVCAFPSDGRGSPAAVNAQYAATPDGIDGRGAWEERSSPACRNAHAARHAVAHEPNRSSQSAVSRRRLHPRLAPLQVPSQCRSADFLRHFWDLSLFVICFVTITLL